MTDRVPNGTSRDGLVLSEAYAAARELLDAAEAEAVRIRTDADRYMRQREQEAELLVGKARRLLEVAERRAESITSDPVPTDDGPPPRHAAADAPVRIDLDAEAAADWSAKVPARRIETDLDRMLADAIARAFDRSFPAPH